MSGRVLIVEDDALISSMIRVNLVSEGYEVRVCGSAEEARRVLRDARFDLLVLDYMLPGMDGQALLAALRAEGTSTPVLMLTARGETELKVSAFARGADDYLVKPFDMMELTARIGALIRRSQAALELPASSRVRVGHAWVDVARQVVVLPDGEEQQASDKEAALLAMFAREPGKVLSRADIIEEVWGMDATPTERTVDNFIVRLRRWIEPEPASPRHLLSVRGRGYRYEP